MQTTLQKYITSSCPQINFRENYWNAERKYGLTLKSLDENGFTAQGCTLVCSK